MSCQLANCSKCIYFFCKSRMLVEVWRFISRNYKWLNVIWAKVKNLALSGYVFWRNWLKLLWNYLVCQINKVSLNRILKLVSRLEWQFDSSETAVENGTNFSIGSIMKIYFTQSLGGITAWYWKQSLFKLH